MNTSTAPSSTRTSRSTPRSTMVSTGISGSTTAEAAAHARERRSESLKARVIVGTASPSRARIGALQELQLGQDVAKVLAVASGAAAGLHPITGGKLQVRLGENRDERALPSRADAGAIDGDAGFDQRPLDVVGLEHLSRVRPQIIERLLGAAMALLGAVAQPDGPLAGVANVIGELLRALGGDGCERCVLRARQRLEIRMRAGRIEQLAQDRNGEIAVGLLDQEDVAVFARIAPIGERVLVPPPGLQLTGIGVERSRLADQIERHIAERQILLEHGRVTAPFR